MKYLRVLCFWALALSASATSIVLVFLPSAPVVAYYVSTSGNSPAGNDSNAGTLAAPFLTAAHAKAMMEASSSNPQVVYFRGGTYSSFSLSLGSADSGQVWSQYIPDGYGTAILDGGASSPTTGGNPITIDGASTVTINGFTIQNCKNWGVGLHGGSADSGNGWASATSAITNDSVTNNVISNCYTTQNTGWGGGAVYAQGNVQNLTIGNNVATNQYGSCYRVGGANGDGGFGKPADYNITGLTISANVCLVSDQYPGDNGAIYVQDELSVSTGITISNNFVRDYQNLAGTYNGQTPKRDLCVYLDQGASNVTGTGNVCANTTNTITSPSGLVPSAAAFYSSSGKNNHLNGNIIDIGNGKLADFNFECNPTHYTCPGLTGDQFDSNIVIGNFTGTQQGFGSGNGPFGVPTTNNGQPLTWTHGFYFGYGSGSPSTTGTQQNDAAPTTGSDPLFITSASECIYTLNVASPAFNSPVSFPGIAAGWGPPGYAVPCTGTAPSYP